jgi:protein gp37
MGKTTKIDYADATWSPWIGCYKCDEHGAIREGCRHCYAEMWARRNPRFRGHWGRDAPRYFFGSKHWHQPWAWNENAKHDGVPRLVLPSLCDPLETLPVGHSQQAQLAEERLRFWDLIERTPWLRWLVLTKRPENLTPERLPARALPNLWLGVSAWDQPSADRNIPLLLEVPAAVHWVSLEPLLGPVGVSRWLEEQGYESGGPAGWIGTHDPLSWVVVGCESRGAWPGRRCEPAWAQTVVTQCLAAGVPCYTKQLELPTWPGRLVKSKELAAYGWPVQMPGPQR